jgi:hypothetical protein
VVARTACTACCSCGGQTPSNPGSAPHQTAQQRQPHLASKRLFRWLKAAAQIRQNALEGVASALVHRAITGCQICHRPACLHHQCKAIVARERCNRRCARGIALQEVFHQGANACRLCEAPARTAQLCRPAARHIHLLHFAQPKYMAAWEALAGRILARAAFQCDCVRRSCEAAAVQPDVGVVAVSLHVGRR